MSSATYYVKKPDGTTTTWGCSVENTTQGIVYYSTASASDFNVAGKYIIHTVVVFSGGSQYTSEVKTFNVYSKYTY